MKKIKLLLVTFLTGMILTGCSSSQLSEVYDEEVLKSDAKATVNLMLDGKYEELVDKFDEELKTQVDVKAFEDECEAVLNQLGEFKSFEKEAVVGEDDIAGVVVFSEFENGKVQFTVSYNEEMKLLGYVIK